MNTLGQCKGDAGLLKAANVAPTNPAFIGYVNRAVRELMDAGDWWNTVAKARMVAYSGGIAWPAWVGSERAVNVCNRPVALWNRWWSMIPTEPRDYQCRRPLRGPVEIENDGTTPVFQNIVNGPNTIRVYRRMALDANKTIAFIGVDANGQPYTETLALPPGLPGYIDTANTFQRVDQVVKDVTVGCLDVYQLSPATGQVFDMAHYLPSETNPDYQHSRIVGGCPSNSLGQIPLTILAKQQFVPVSINTDIVQIDNVQALETMIYALKDREASSSEGYATNRGIAIKLLNAQLRDKMPDEQTPITVDAWGTALPSRRGIGRMM
jgi:hypothetical protein